MVLNGLLCANMPLRTYSRQTVMEVKTSSCPIVGRWSFDFGNIASRFVSPCLVRSALSGDVEWA